MSVLPMGVTGWRKSDRFTFVRGCTTPVPALPRYVTALTRALDAGEALIASITCAAVLARSPSASVPSVTRMFVPRTATLRGEFAAAGSRISTVMSLPPSWPHALEVMTTALDCELPVAVLPEADSPQKNGTPLACASVSGAVRLTFGAGDAGFGVTTDAIVRRSWFAPVSTEMTCPARSPVVLETRTAVAPAGAATDSVVALAARVACALRCSRSSCAAAARASRCSGTPRRVR